MYKKVNGEDVKLSEKELKELERDRKKLRKKRLKRQYKRNRQFAYPPISDQLDAILKQIDLLDKKQLHPEMKKILTQWKKVKQENPK